MADSQITCIRRRDPRSNHDGITHVGGAGWLWSVDEVVRSIESKTNTFFVRSTNSRSDVGVVNGPTGKYLRTYANGQWNDNLLSLPECPRS